MDLFLSLPIFSYLLAPALTSWTTSLNLLFFYVTWTTLILSHHPLKIQLIGVVAIRTALWLVPSIVFFLFDLAVPSISEAIKYGGKSALPPRRFEDAARTLAMSLANFALCVLSEGLVSFALAHLLGEPVLKVSSTLPMPWHMAKHVGLILSAREVLTYYIHRHLLHDIPALLSRRSFSSSSSSINKVSRRISSQHKSIAHARRAAPFSLALYADHTIPLILHRLVPLLVPAMVVRPHLLTYLLCTAIVAAEETVAMSGYSAIPGIIVGGIVQRTAIHYASGGTSNFGAWGVLDWFHGTSRGRDVLDDVRREADKHQVKERGENKVSDAAGLVQSGLDGLRRGRSADKTKQAN